MTDSRNVLVGNPLPCITVPQQMQWCNGQKNVVGNRLKLADWKFLPKKNLKISIKHQERMIFFPTPQRTPNIYIQGLKKWI